MTYLFAPNRDAEAEATEILRAAIELHQPTHVFGMFSGGHDSLCATHLASRHPAFTGAVHIHTGIGVEETRQFVRLTCAVRRWKLLEYHAPMPSWAPDMDPPPVTAYEAYVRRWGFPGPFGHGVIYRRLKERCVRQLTRDHVTGRGAKIMLVGGMRLAESTRRMFNAEEVGTDGARVWVSPIIHWDGYDKAAYMARHNLPRNRVVENLCMSGECLCGAFAKPGELDDVRKFYPDAAAEIDRVSAGAAAAGVHAVWGTRPPKRERQGGQMRMDMCWSCNAKGGAA
jgi:3'-phosphoadenosine 5'-phosphosulfate sulfotransferase (PAPS reductase)/FAD synthetase